jgi:hypothetical protein
LFSPSLQRSSSPVGFGQDFLSKEERDDIGTSHTHSPDLVPTDFYLFPGQKSALMVRRFCGASSIITNATEELKRF